MRNHEPIGIVGVGCRFPGFINNPGQFWDFLRNGSDAISEVPPERWNASRFYHPDPTAPGRMVTRWGGFVANADRFDAAFFGIAPREAARVDPQHRWLAEVTWEALEDAGLPPEQLAGTRTGVFIGISTADYPALNAQQRFSINGYANIGSGLCIAANRLSYLFNFRGPSFAVDTACSSSLVALHLAVQSLRSGECDYAIVGAANELLSPDFSIGFSHAGMLSPTGRCRAFAAGADGYVRAEGAAAVVLMPLSRAKSLELHSRALLLATASNQDGHTSSLTVPNGQAQEEVIREALKIAGADPGEVVYVEAHGTGTPVGDPIEAHALAAVLGKARKRRLLVGSVKTNLGHLEPAAGMAGLIKATLMLQHGGVPPNLHFAAPHPLLPQEIDVPTVFQPLPNSEKARRLIAVNSFGFGGSNAGAILAAAAAPGEPAAEPENTLYILPLSARSPQALADYATEFARLIGEETSLRDLCAAAALGKSHHSLRAALLADSPASLRSQLEAIGLTGARPNVPARGKTAFIFSGQGPQSPGMGRQLYGSEPIVQQVWQQCDTVCRGLGGPALLDILLRDDAAAAMARTEIAQPALFALQAGVTALWRSWGIEPDFTLGHSVGEAAAAWAAGIFDLEQIFRVILKRSRLQARTRGLGRMLAASISPDDAREWEKRFPGQVCLAALNAGRQVTLSGDAEALQVIAITLEKEETFYRFLPGEYAFHSPAMDGLESELRLALTGLAGAASNLAMISTVTGREIAGSEIDAEYWWRNVRAPVLFSAGVESLLDAGCTVFVEIGPHPVLGPALAEIAASREVQILHTASLRRDHDERITIRTGLSALYENGAPVRWEAFYKRPTHPVRLPAYPWQRQQLWHESPAYTLARKPPAHPLLGDRQPDPLPSWLNHLDARLVPWLSDHRLSGAAAVPAAAYLEMAAAAARELLGEPVIFLESVSFRRLLFLPEGQPVPTSVRLDPAAGTFEIYAASPETPSKWDLHARGRYRPGRLQEPPPIDLDRLHARFSTEHEPRVIYGDLAEIGQLFGPTFQRMTSVKTDENEALSTVQGSEESPDYLLFPPSLDSCFHALAALRTAADSGSLALVESVRQVKVFRPWPERAWSHARVERKGDDLREMDVTVYDPRGAVVANVQGLLVRSVRSDAARGRERRFYQLAWEPEGGAHSAGSSSEAVAVFADDAAAGSRIVESLQRRKINATLAAGDPSAASRFPSRIVFLRTNDDPGCCAALLALVQACLASGVSQQVRWLIVTREAQPVQEGDPVRPALAALWGFARTMQTEYPQWQVSLLDYSGETLPGDAVADELLAAEIEPEVACRDTARFVRRLRQAEPKAAHSSTNTPSFALETGQTGLVDSLRFRGRERRAPLSGKVEIEVAAAALNFRDLMKALGIYPSKNGVRLALGDEFSGRVLRVGRRVRNLKPGDRVMGILVSGGAFASHLTVPADEVWKIPGNLDFIEAASVPVIFATAYHALHSLARLRRGETVLIHAAAGGVGLAAIQLALGIGAVVLGTAGTEQKRAYLRSIGVAHVMNSRTLDFGEETRRFTGGRGVDVVLNSLAGPFLQTSLEACAPHGRFVEIGLRDIVEDKPLPMQVFQRSLSFFAFDLGTVMSMPGPARVAMRRFITQGFARRKLRPVPHTRFAADEAIPAFQLMQGAGHIGKIVLDFQREHPCEVPAEFWPKPDATYLITGGSRGFGLATAQWLAGRGATHLALLSRSGVAPDPSAIDELRAREVSVTVLAADVADARSLARALRKLHKKAPPLAGIFHAAAVLHDVQLAAMTQEHLAHVLSPKATGAWNLHVQTRELPLDCFVLYSSVSSLLGTAGQANYAAANSFLDALAHLRRSQGLSALSVNWGQISDSGFVAERPELGRYLTRIGVGGLSSGEALAALPQLIAAGETQIAVAAMDWEKIGRASAKFGASPVFQGWLKAAQSASAEGVEAWRDSVLRLPVEARPAAITELVVAQLAATLGMKPAEIDPARPISDYGIDSLMAVELRTRIQSHTGCELPFTSFHAKLSAARLVEQIAEELNASHQPEPASAARPIPTGAQSSAAPLFRAEAAPLHELVQTGQLPQLIAAALMPWPSILLEQLGMSPETFFQVMNGGRVSLDLILETPLGAVGLFMLPMTAAQVTPGAPDLLPHLVEGIEGASACGARCVALTGLIPSATNYGADVHAACQARSDLATVTTGHATTIAAVLLNLEALLKTAGRELAEEKVMFYGVGSIGLGALRLMLDVLPHPAELHLYDPYRGAAFFRGLEETLRHTHGFTGAIIPASSPSDAYDASMIVGATNIENVIDANQLAPGTLVVDDSWPHCMNGPAAFSRFVKQADILMTEGGFVRSPDAMPRIAHVPAGLASDSSVDLPQLLFSTLDPHDITACVLSALFSARRPDLPPTIGLVSPDAARRHWDALREMGFTASAHGYEGNALSAAGVHLFRERFATIPVRSPGLPAAG